MGDLARSLAGWLIDLAAAHPITTIGIIAGLFGVPWGIGAWLNARPSLGSTRGKHGILLSLAAIVHLVEHRRTLAKMAGVAGKIAAVVAAVTIFAVWTGPVTLAGLVIGSWWAGERYFSWLGGRHVEPTREAHRAAARRHRSTDIVADALAATTPEGLEPTVSVAEIDETTGRISMIVEPGVGPSGTVDQLRSVADSGALGNAIRQLAPAYGDEPLSVTDVQIIDAGPEEGKARLTVYSGDPHQTVHPLPEAAFRAAPDDNVLVGVATDGHQVELPIDGEPRMLVAGLSGFGKSNFLAGFIAQLASRAHTAIVLADPKRQEFGAWAPRATSIGLGNWSAQMSIRMVWCEMIARQHVSQPYIDPVTRSLIDPVTGAPATQLNRKNVTSAETPRVVLVIDEWTEMEKAPKPSKAEADAIVACLEPIFGHRVDFSSEHLVRAKVGEVARSIVTMGRAVGVDVVFTVQRPTTEAIDGQIRDNLTLSLAFKLKKSIDTNMVFGDDSSAKCHQIRPHQKGVGYVLEEGHADAVQFRAFYVDDSDLIGFGERWRDLRVDFGWPGVIPEAPWVLPDEDDEG
jgi:S-DNA-T family DNA segregation ATPase FtsK/SpoIIIE